LHWLWKYGLPAAPILAVLIYGILRQLYATFYGTLGAQPEEVGLGYQQVLSLSGVAILILALVTTAFLLVRLPLLQTRLNSTPGRMVSTALAALSLIGGLWWMHHQAQTSAGRAYEGHAVRSVNISALQVLGLRAEPSLVQWSDKIPSGADTISGHCLMYLGSADGVAVFFDPGPHSVRTIRLQTSAIVVTAYRTVPGTHHPAAQAGCSGGKVSPGD
jgi:hypothetical protein